MQEADFEQSRIGHGSVSLPYPSDAELFEEEDRIRSGNPPSWIQRDSVTSAERWERTRAWLRQSRRQQDIDNADDAAIETLNIERERWERIQAWVREGGRRWRENHPAEVEAARLKEENLRLHYELEQAKSRETELIRRGSSNRDFAVILAVYFGGGLLIWLLFSGTHPSRAWNAAVAASWS